MAAPIVSSSRATTIRGRPQVIHFKQLLVDGAVVWEEDVAGGTNGWNQVAVDVTAQAKSKAAIRLAFRLLDKRGVGNFGAHWQVRDLHTENLQLAADPRRNRPLLFRHGI